MINNIFMANLMQSELNNNSLGKNFLIFADEGDMVQSKKIGNYKLEYTHGVLEIISDNIVPFEDLEFQTINTRLMLFVDLVSKGQVEETEINRKQSRNLIEVKECFEEVLKRINGTSSYIKFEDKTYNLTIAMSTPTNGQKMDLGGVSEGVPLYVSIQFTIFQNGVNSNYCKIKVNGESLGYTQLVKTKNGTANQSNIGNDGARTYILAGGKSFDFVVPLLTSGVTQEFVKHLYNDELNTAFEVEFEYPDISYHFICVLGKIQETNMRGTNATLNISLAQGVEDILNYDERWIIQDTEESQITLSGVELGNIVYWGDNSWTIISTNEDRTHTYTKDKKHKIKIFKG